jgi:23S rRNA pseudouridine1911/1915/1917 synthase
MTQSSEFPSQLAPTVIFEDTHLLVLNKPEGLLSQGEHTGDWNLVDWCRGYFGRNYVGLIHRLDRNTSGILVVAKRTKSAQRLTAALQNGTLERSYLAWALGRSDQTLTLEDYLQKNEKTNESRVVRAGTQGAKRATLKATPLAHSVWQSQPITLFEVELDTGRSNQIRVQLAHARHPLLGDIKYGAGSWAAKFPRLALHSHHIRFPHPMGGTLMEFKSPLPADLEKLKEPLSG